MNKPYIALNEDFPGIISLFMFDKGMAKHLSGMAQELMRRESSGLTIGERELIAALVSNMNDCDFCYSSHKSCALETAENPDIVTKFFDGKDSEVLSMKMRALTIVAFHVTYLNRDQIGQAIQDAKGFGATDQDIHDTVAITAMFCMCNRYVDGLGTTFKPGEPAEGGKSLAKYGYLMTPVRFAKEVVPKIFSSIFGKMSQEGK